MTPQERAQVKKGYFDLLDLIIKYRIKEVLGKTGLTHLPKTEVDAIEDLKFQTSLRVLHGDKILDFLKNGNKEIIYDIQDGEIIVDCLKTAEEMVAYKNSLIVEEGWPSVEVITLGSGASLHYRLRKRNMSNNLEKLSAKEGTFLTYFSTGNNREKSREEIATETGFSEIQVSNFKNVIRKKLVRIGFSEEEAGKMLPSYRR